MKSAVYLAMSWHLLKQYSEDVDSERVLSVRERALLLLRHDVSLDISRTISEVLLIFGPIAGMVMVIIKKNLLTENL